jgi:hypothetical protein
LIRELAFETGYRELNARRIAWFHPKVLGLLDYRRLREPPLWKIVVFFSVTIGSPGRMKGVILHKWRAVDGDLRVPPVK